MKMFTFFAPWAIGVYSELVIVGTNPEMADYDNPRGHIIQERWFIMAEAKDGRRKVLHGVMFADPVEAGFFANLYTGWDPENFDESVWMESRPMYGSEAWINSGTGEEEADYERREGGYYGY